MTVCMQRKGERIRKQGGEKGKRKEEEEVEEKKKEKEKEKE